MGFQLAHDELVREINRIYHEQEAAVYDAHHPEIFTNERQTWEQLLRFLPQKQGGGIIVLDVGGGTGFVAEVLSSALGEADKIILLDISPNMLEQARAKISDRTSPQFEFVVADAEHLPLADTSCDVITVNSVLHHLPDTQKFLKEVDRVLKPGGVLLVAHEPNRLYWQNSFLRMFFWIMQKLNGLTYRVRRVMRPHTTAATSHDVYAKIYGAVNSELMRKGLAARPLSPEEIQQYVDVHSPTASGVSDSSKGFHPQEFFRRYVPAYQLLYCKTKAHLGKFSSDANVLLAAIDMILRWLFPKSGSSFALVLKKPPGAS